MPYDVRFIVADVDGTLLTPERVLTPHARAVVRTIVEVGIGFTITSSRPPRGMKMLIDDLDLKSPISAFNGGLIVQPDLAIIHEHLLAGNVAQSVIDILQKHGVNVWVYDDKNWFVTACDGPHVASEAWTLRFPPTVVSTYEGRLDRVVKIVGVSDDSRAIARCGAEVRQHWGRLVSAALSQPYYLDVTNSKANKGEVVSALSSLLSIPTAQIATIGDMPNDMPMFERSGLSIAMGNASLQVKRAATFVTTSNSQEGFALAMEKFVLGRPDRMS